MLRVHPVVEFAGKRVMSDATAKIASKHTTSGAPSVTFEALPEFKHYTIALVDPDAPDAASRTLQHRFHWVVSNIPAGETGRADAKNGHVVVPYEQIHPEKGSLAHRVVLAVYGQHDQVDLAAPAAGALLQPLAASANLELVGLVMREFEWDESVSMFYDDDEPLFGSAQRPVNTREKFKYVARPSSV